MKGKKSTFYILILFSAFIIFLPGLAKEKIVESRWAELPVTIDGSEDDWSSAALATEEDAGVDYAVRNDLGNLYILFIIKDPKFLSTIEATGISVYFNPEGKKKKDQGLRFFKKKVTADELLSVFEKQGQVLTEEQRAEIKSKASYILYDYEVLAKKKETKAEAPTSAGSQLPTFKYEKKGEMTIYEFRIPLSQENQPAGIGTGPGQSIKVGFEWGGLTKEMQAARIQRTTGEAERGAESETKESDHARRTEGGSFSTATPSSGMRRTGPKKYLFWADIKLAPNPQ